MKLTAPRVRSRVAGAAVALALAGGGTAALTAGPVTHSAAQVRPGDMISASVKRSGTSYTLSVSDPVHPQNRFSAVQTCPATTCEDQSAEWIAERPAFSIGITPLATFANWTLSNGSQTVNGVKGSIAAGPNSTGIEIIDATETYPLDSVSGLTGGTSFTAHWLNSY